MQKRHKTWLICSLLMYKRYTNTFSFSTTIPFYVFFYVTKYTLVYNVLPRKMFKMCFNRADYLILFQINILAIRTLTIDMFRRTNYKKKCIHCFIKQVLLKRKNTIAYKYCIYHNLQIVGLQTLQTL